MNACDLFGVRKALIQAYLRRKGRDGILISRVDNFAMATGGKRNYVSTASETGACSLFITRAGDAYFVGNTIEKPRVMDEELGALGCGARDFLWFDDTAANVVRCGFPGAFVSDDGSLGANVHGELAVLRTLLTPAELEKYRVLGRHAAEAMAATLDRIAPGMAEADVMALLVAEGARRRCQVPVALVAADERIRRYRHPLPTAAPLVTGHLEERPVRGYAMVAGGFLCEGLVVSLTRFKQVGDLPEGVADAMDRICGVDAVMQEATVPGRTLGDVFAACQDAYKALGFPANEWHNHHQGGATGYAGRTCRATPGQAFPVLDPSWTAEVAEISGIAPEFGAAFAWNPSAPGVKSEDTFILRPDGAREIVSRTPGLTAVDLSRVLGRPTEAVKTPLA